MYAREHCFRLLCLMLLSAPLAAEASDPLYSVTAFGGAGSYASGINNAGQLVGGYLAGGTTEHAFLYSGSMLLDLGTLGGQSSYARGINDAGQVVGSAYTAGGLRHAFLYTGGAMSDLGTLGGPTSDAYAINNAGTVSGESQTTSALTFPFAFRYAGGAMQNLGALPGGLGSRAYGISNSGQIVGDSFEGPFTQPDYPYHAMFYSGGQMTNIGLLSVGDSTAYAINDSGQVVGASTTPQTIHDTHAFLYVAGGITDLGLLPGGYSSAAFDINGLGQVVGAAEAAASGDYRGPMHGFLHTAQDGMRDLNTLIDSTSGWTITNASGINELQQISGTACKGGQCFAVRLDLMPAVPEPEAYGLLLAGLALLGLMRRVK